MSEIKAGIIMASEFCKSNDRAFKGYIDYIARDEATRLKANSKFNIFSMYNDYMDNPDKIGGLFTKELDSLNMDEKKHYKHIFEKAQENGSLMWQSVFSFDNRWLLKVGILSSDDVLNDKALKTATRKALDKLLISEKMETASYTCAIHYNTDNIHIHTAIVEEVPKRAKKLYTQYEMIDVNGKPRYKLDSNKNKVPILDAKGNIIQKEEYIGKFKERSIAEAKSIFANELLKELNINKNITNLMRDVIQNKFKYIDIRKEKRLEASFYKLYKNIDVTNLSHIKYGSKYMKEYIPKIDNLTNMLIDTYIKDEYAALMDKIDKADKIYIEAYGASYQGYKENKIGELYKNLGNIILKEIRELKKEERENAVMGIDDDSLDAVIDNKLEPKIDDGIKGLQVKDKVAGGIEIDFTGASDSKEVKVFNEVVKSSIDEILNTRLDNGLNIKSTDIKDINILKEKLLNKEIDKTTYILELKNLYLKGNVLGTYNLYTSIPKAIRGDSNIPIFHSKLKEELKEARNNSDNENRKKYISYLLGKLNYKPVNKDLADINDAIANLNVSKESRGIIGDLSSYYLGNIYYMELEEKDIAIAVSNYMDAKLPIAYMKLGDILDKYSSDITKVKDLDSKYYYNLAEEEYLKEYKKSRRENKETDPFSLMALARINYKGLGKEIDYEESKKYSREHLKTYSKLNDVNDFNNKYASFIYISSLISSKDNNYDEEALNTAISSLNNSKDEYALYMLGKFYESYAPKVDIKKAVDTYLKLDTDFSKVKLASIYLSNNETGKALDLLNYLKDTERFSLYANKKLGYIYMSGKYVEKDIDKALEYFKEASYLGDEKSKEILDAIREKQKAYQKKISTYNKARLRLARVKSSSCKFIFEDSEKVAKYLNEQEYEKLEHEIEHRDELEH